MRQSKNRVLLGNVAMVTVASITDAWTYHELILIQIVLMITKYDCSPFFHGNQQAQNTHE